MTLALYQPTSKTEFMHLLKHQRVPTRAEACRIFASSFRIGADGELALIAIPDPLAGSQWHARLTMSHRQLTQAQFGVVTANQREETGRNLFDAVAVRLTFFSTR